MFNLDLIYRARWDQLFSYFAGGYPPLILKLLVINTIFIVLFIIRRTTAKHKLRPNTAYAIQGVLIAANVATIFANDIFGMTSSARSMLHF
jgi:hypothetical protein